jgi:signal transduction histidine kinase
MDLPALRLPASIKVALAAALLALAMMTLSSAASVRRQHGQGHMAMQHAQTLAALLSVLALVQDAESGQRGYLLTGDAKYLAPYQEATQQLGPALTALDVRAKGTPLEPRLPELRELCEEKVAELSQTIRLRREQGAQAALDMVLTGHGKITMERLRDELGSLREQQVNALAEVAKTWEGAAAGTLRLLFGGMLVIALLAAFLVWQIGRHLRLQHELAERQAHEARFRQRLLGIVGHDLRGPLTAVRASTESILREPGRSPRTQSAGERILRSGARMEAMVRDLLDFTKVELGGQLPIAPEPSSLRDVLQRAMDEARVVHPDAQLELRVEQDAQGVWDPRRLEQLAANLLANAVQYGERGKPVLVSQRTEGPNAVFEVHNEGEPIPPEVQQHLFEPFTRGRDDAESTNRRSVGLGLYIARQVVTAHGGSIDVVSDAPGTTVRVRLPL